MKWPADICVTHHFQLSFAGTYSRSVLPLDPLQLLGTMDSFQCRHYKQKDLCHIQAETPWASLSSGIATSSIQASEHA